MMQTLRDAFQAMHPALLDPNILHWADIVETLGHKQLAIYGAGQFGKSLAQYLASEKLYTKLFIDQHPTTDNLSGIPVYTLDEAKPHITDEFIIIVSIQKYPGDQELYLEIQRTFAEYGLPKPYYIHDFSAGFPLGANLIHDRMQDICKAYDCLRESPASQKIFTDFIERAKQCYAKGMEYSESTYGIPNPRQLSPNGEAPLPDLSTHLNGKIYISCCTGDWEPKSPLLKTGDSAKYSLYYYPVQLSRYKLKEHLYYHHEKPSMQQLGIFSQILSSACTSVELPLTTAMGGTPLKPKRKGVLHCQGVTVDSLMEALPNDILGALHLHMESNYHGALSGAMQTLQKHTTIIMVTGFQQANSLWECILAIDSLFPTYRIRLHHYPHENPIMGNCVYALPPEIDLQ